jgi:hypothetical protein
MRRSKKQPNHSGFFKDQLSSSLYLYVCGVRKPRLSQRNLVNDRRDILVPHDLAVLNILRTDGFARDVD